MSELLGLLDSLEAVVLEGKKIPLSDKALLDEVRILQIIDKMRYTMQHGSNIARKAVDVSKDELKTDQKNSKKVDSNSEIDPQNIVIKAKEDAKKMKNSATEYADVILANVQLMVSKMQKNLVKLERNLESGRKTLDTHKKDEGNKDEVK
jgi:hypothetical protein